MRNDHRDSSSNADHADRVHGSSGNGFVRSRAIVPKWLTEIRRPERDRFFTTDGHAWIRFHKWGFMRFPPNDVAPVNETEKRELFYKAKAAVISNHHLPLDHERSNALLYLCTDRLYDISKLSANNRSKVRRGNNRLQFRSITAATVAEKGYTCYRDTCLRNGISPISESAYIAKWSRNKTEPSNREIFAVFAGEEMAAISVVWICGKWAEIFSTQSANKYLKDYSNHVLFFNLLSNLLHRDGIESVSYGLSSVQPESKVDSLHHFKLSVNFQAVPVVRTITVNPVLRPAINHLTLRCSRMLTKAFPTWRQLLAARGALELMLQDHSQPTVPYNNEPFINA